MTDVDIGSGSAIREVSPKAGTKIYYVEAPKAAQNDTLTFSDVTTVTFASLMVGSSHAVAFPETPKKTSTANQIKLTDAETGSVWGIVGVEE